MEEPRIFRSLNCPFCSNPFSTSIQEDHGPRMNFCGSTVTVCKKCFREQKKLPLKERKHQCGWTDDCFLSESPSHYLCKLLQNSGLDLTPNRDGYILIQDIPIPRCSKCAQEFSLNRREMEPYALFCGHSICNGCFEKLKIPIEDPNGYWKYGVECPECIRDCWYRGTTWRDPLKDFLRELPMMQKELAKRRNNGNCEECQDGISNLIAFQCLDCKKSLCSMCFFLRHQEHKIVDLYEEEESMDSTNLNGQLQEMPMINESLVLEIHNANLNFIQIDSIPFFQADPTTNHLQITLPLDFMDTRFCEWWGLSSPYLQINLHFDLIDYRFGDYPKVSVFRSDMSQNIATFAVEMFISETFTKSWKSGGAEDLNYLSVFIDELVFRLKELGNFCVQCGIKHLGAHPFLTVCDHQTYGERQNLRGVYGHSMGPRLWMDSAQLLLYLFFQANQSGRRNLICKPDPLDDRGLGFLDCTQLTESLKGYCTRCVFSTWKSYETFRDTPQMKSKSDLLYWLSDRFPMICRLPPRFRVQSMQTANQYLLPPVPNEKESRFQALLDKNRGQKFYAFHGSPVENWYKILSEGLMVCSGTNLQLVGTAHGNGIYLGKQPKTSEQYSKRQTLLGNGNGLGMDCAMADHRRRNEEIKSGTWCLALVEVVNDPSKIQDHGWCYVVTDPDLVQIRILFIYQSAISAPNIESSNFSANHQEMRKVEEAMHFFAHGDYRERLSSIMDSDFDGNHLSAQVHLLSHRYF